MWFLLSVMFVWFGLVGLWCYLVCVCVSCVFHVQGHTQEFTRGLHLGRLAALLFILVVEIYFCVLS